VRGSKSQVRKLKKIDCKYCLKAMQPGGYGARNVKGLSWCNGCDGNLVRNSLDGSGKKKERARAKKLCKESL